MTFIVFILGILGSLIAAAMFPVLGSVTIAMFVRIFGWLPIRGRVNLVGNWNSTWHVKSERYPEQVTSNTTVRQLGNRVFIRFAIENMSFIAHGRIEDGRYVTGTWADQTKGGYHGAFQLIIDPKTRNMRGLWIGFSASRSVVKHGDWVWRKINRGSETADSEALATKVHS